MKYTPVILVFIILLLNACSPRPKAIAYGTDGCHYCRMTIVDKVHGAELVTKKGKVFKFDAVECMVNYRKEIDTLEVALYLSNHYTIPGELINATTATFLISKNIPSPMGAFITTFENRSDALKVKSEKGGELYSWGELLEKLN